MEKRMIDEIRKHLKNGGWIEEVNEVDPKLFKKLKTKKESQPLTDRLSTGSLKTS